MKIAIFSDIHGNMEALTAVLADIKKQNVDKFFILGDLAMAGPEPSETIDFIRNDVMKNNDVTIIQGNTDEMICDWDYNKVQNLKRTNPLMAHALVYAQEILSEDQKTFLRELPATKSVTIGKLSFLLVHGSPRRNNEDIPPAQPIEMIAEMLVDVSEDIILCGHTHLPAGYQASKQTVINDGSVGRPFTDDKKACYVLINYPDLDTSEIEISHEFVKYDNEKAADKLRRLPFEGSSKLAETLVKSTERYPK